MSFILAHSRAVMFFRTDCNACRCIFATHPTTIDYENRQLGLRLFARLSSRLLLGLAVCYAARQGGIETCRDEQEMMAGKSGAASKRPSTPRRRQGMDWRGSRALAWRWRKAPANAPSGTASDHASGGRHNAFWAGELEAVRASSMEASNVLGPVGVVDAGSGSGVYLGAVGVKRLPFDEPGPFEAGSLTVRPRSRKRAWPSSRRHGVREVLLFAPHKVRLTIKQETSAC